MKSWHWEKSLLIRNWSKFTVFGCQKKLTETLKRSKVNVLHSKWSILGVWHRSWTSKLQYEPSGLRLSLVMAEIRPISNWKSLAVKDLKIAVALGKVDFSDQM